MDEKGRFFLNRFAVHVGLDKDYSLHVDKNYVMVVLRGHRVECKMEFHADESKGIENLTHR